MKTKERQQKLRDKRKEAGWKFIWIPPHLIQKVKNLIKGNEE
jgi:hypothetical protein